MHLLEIGATQPAFGKHLGVHRAQIPFYDKASSSRSFFYGNEKVFYSAWKLFGVGKALSFNFRSGHGRPSGGAFLIKAVATLEPKRLVGKNSKKHLGLSNSQLVIDKNSPPGQTQLNDEDLEDSDDRERLRRERISRANSGRSPWNKGKKHSPETIQRIRERTRIAMQDPKVKKKLLNTGHPQTEETKIKIAVGVRKGWKKRQNMLRLQETCHFDWQNLIAEASRKGYSGEAELQWNSYEILNEKLQEEWLESIERRKSTPRLKGSKRAPKSPEQKRKISEAISRKWADTDYRKRVVSALAKYHGLDPEEVGKSRKRSSGDSENPRRSPARKAAISRLERTINPKAKLRKRNAPSYKDPLASSKLEMIKNIRAQRVSMETKKFEAVERAKLLIAEAEKAAKALEAAAEKSPLARASLIETRKLIAEAIRSINSIETEPISSRESNDDSSVVQEPAETDATKENIPIEPRPVKVNGSRTLVPFSKEKGFSLSSDKLNLNNIPNGDINSSPIGHDTQATQSGSMNENGFSDNEVKPPPLVNGTRNVETLTEQAPPKAVTITKKWVRGRLVEVAEGES